MNRTLKHTVLFTMLGGLVLSVPAFAEHHEKDDHAGKGMMAMADTNKDGRISAAESAAVAQGMFDKMDANHDGKIAADEMKADHRMKRGMRHGNMMSMMDTNKDGVLTSAENASAAQARFDRMDPNKDGKITADEMAVIEKTMMERRRGKADGHDGMKHDGMSHDGMKHDGMADGKDHKDMMRRHAGMGAGMMHAQMDANKDGAISAAEHAAGVKAMFTRMDTNKDGYVTKAEMDAGHAAMGKAK